jgi:hypothetical protein
MTRPTRPNNLASLKAKLTGFFKKNFGKIFFEKLFYRVGPRNALVAIGTKGPKARPCPTHHLII